MATSIAAMVISLIPRSVFPGRGIGAYDFSTPQHAAKSAMEMEAAGDVLAAIELQVYKATVERDRTKSKIASLVFERTVEHDGKVLLLYKYQDGGLERREAQWFEKKGARYYSIFVSTLGWSRLGGDKARIAKLVSDWEDRQLPEIP